MDKTNLLPITGIGSLPFEDIKEAIDYSLQHDIPFIPQLPSIEGSMIQQIKEEKYTALEHWGREHECYKIQLVGPQTSKVKFEQIISYAQKLKVQLHQTPILFIDEPVLNTIDKEYIDFYDKLSKEFKIGLHCCANTDWNEVLKLPLSYISFDASHFESQFPYTDFLNKNIKIVLGLIPTDTTNYSIDEIYKKHKDLILAHPEKIWLSPACGLGLHTQKHAYKVLTDLKELRNRFLSNI